MAPARTEKAPRASFERRYLQSTGEFNMTKYLCIAVAMMFVVATGDASFAASTNKSEAAAKIDRDVDAALKNLYASSPVARSLRSKAKAILVFPSIVKGGFVVGAQAGEGALRKDGRTVGYYRTLAASYGLQAGIQKFGYAMFLMNDNALAYLDRSEGWEIGAGPSVVVVDAGVAKSLTTTTLREDVYAVVFDQKGLMGGIALQGSKITRFEP